MSYTIPAGYEAKKSSLEKEHSNLELFLISVPKKFNISSLDGVKIEPGRVNDLQVNDALPGNITTSFKLTSFGGQDCDVIPLVHENEKLKIGQPVNGFLNVTKCYNYESKPYNNNLPRLQKQTSHKVPMPEGLKERFMPFGAGSPTKTPHHGRPTKHDKKSRDMHVSPDHAHGQQEKRKKRDKLKKTFITDSTPSLSLNGSLIVNSLPEPHTCLDPSVVQTHVARSKKKHKNHKKDMQEETNSYFISHNGDVPAETCETSEIVYSGKHKKKKKNVSFSQEDSVFMDNSGDFSRLEERLKQENTEFCDSSLSTGSKENGKTKKRKRKFSSGYDSGDTSLDSSQSHMSYDQKNKRRKKEKNKDHVIEDSFLDHSVSLASIETIPESNKKRKKKTK